MSTNAAGFDFSKFVPGFDFLRQMAQPNRMAGAPAAQWVAPTVDPEEVDRRIQELRTVLFWLEQNTTALKATIQALEVQKMTLTTLQQMNVGMQDMAKSFSAPMAQMAATPEPAAAPSPAAAQAPAGEPAAPLNQALAQAGQWWGSMLQTFGQIAQQAQTDVAQNQAEFLKTQEEAAQQMAEKVASTAQTVSGAASQAVANTLKTVQQAAVPKASVAKATTTRKTATAVKKPSATSASSSKTTAARSTKSTASRKKAS